MKRVSLFLVLLAAITAGAQVTRTIIPAGTPEDQALQAITAETDAQKRIALLQDFIQKFAENKPALAYGESQLSQQYLEQGDTAKALEWGQKAVELQPNNMEILVALAGAAQKANAIDTIMDCAVRGGTAFNGIAHMPKPEGLSDEEFAARVQSEQNPFRSMYEFLEASALNALVDEKNNKKRMSYIERYITAFPGSRFEDQVNQLAVYTLGQLNNPAQLASFGEKAIAANPKSVGTLVVMADAMAESSDPAFLTRAENYARKALDLIKGQTPTVENKLGLYSGLAHSALGYSLLRQNKALPAVTELKSACTELKGNQDAYAAATYRLGFAYAKLSRYAEARAALTEAMNIKGAYQQLAKEALARVDAAAKGRGRTR